MNRQQQKIQENRWLDCHGNAAVRRGAHHPMKHIQGFIQSQWMPPLVECLRRIAPAPAATMVNEFLETTQNTNKTQVLASNYDTFWALVVCENLTPNGPSTQLINAISFVLMWNSTFGAEEFSYISSYQTLSADKNYKSY